MRPDRKAKNGICYEGWMKVSLILSHKIIYNYSCTNKNYLKDKLFSLLIGVKVMIWSFREITPGHWGMTFFTIGNYFEN